MKGQIVAGAAITGNVDTRGGDFIGRDKVIIQEAPKARIPFVLERPPRTEHFIGREVELAQLLVDLQSGKVVTLCGPGGIGKTALATEAIWQLAAHNQPPEAFPDGIIFHSFYNQPQAVLALEHIARSFGEEPKPTPKEAAQRSLQGRCALLVLDGAEEADDLRSVLEIRNQCGVLVTSRQRKDTIAVRQDVTPLPSDEALSLLQAWGGLRATDSNAARLISDFVGGLPLALRLVGRYLAENEENAADYLTWLEKTPLAALNQGQRRLESIPLLLTRSLAQVSEQARQVVAVIGLLALAPFAHTYITAALALEEGIVRRALGELVNYGLVMRPKDSYEVTHALIQTYARQQLDLASELIQRLGTYYVQRVTENLDAYSQLQHMRPHIMTFLRICGDREAWTTAANLVWAIESYLDLQGYWTDRVTALELGVVAARILQNRWEEGVHLGYLGETYYLLGQIKQAIEFHQQALTLAQEVGDHHSEGRWLGNLGNAYRTLGQVERAIKYHQQALAIARELGDRRGEGTRLGNLGNVYYDLGQAAQAITYQEQALAITREIGDRRSEGTRLGNLGNAYCALGESRRAITYYEQALTIAQELGDRRHEGIWLGNLGNVRRSLGQVEQGIIHYEQALTIAQELGDRRNEGTWLGNLGTVKRDLGQIEQAIIHYEQALSIAQELGDRSNEGIWLDDLGSAYYILGQVNRAQQVSEQALRIFEQTNSPKPVPTHEWLTSVRNKRDTYFS